MSVKLYEPGVAHAKAAAHSGNTDHSDKWDAPDDPKPDDCLAEHPDATEGTKGRCAFPVFANGKLHRKGVIAAKSRAAQEGYKDVENAADEILKIIDAKSTFHGSILVDFTVSKTAVLLSTEKNDAGQPVWKFRKELIRDGNFIHPKTKKRIPVNPTRRKHWEEQGNQMIAAGVRLPINVDHVLSALGGLGTIERFENAGPGLYIEFQVSGDGADKLVSRNDISAGIEDGPEGYVDGTGKAWPDAIYHAAITQFPVITDLNSPSAIAASLLSAEGNAPIFLSAEIPPTGVNKMASELKPENLKTLRGCTHLCNMSNVPDEGMGDALSAWHEKAEDQLSALRREIPGSCPPGDEIPRLTQHLSTLRHVKDKIAGAYPSLLSMTAGETEAAIDSKIDEWSNAAKVVAERDATISELRKVSAKAIKDVPPEAVPFINEGLSSMKARLVAAGFKPFAADMLVNRAMNEGKANPVLCSREANPFGGDRALIFDIAEIVCQGLGGIVPGSQTGTNLSRLAPSDTLHNNEATKKIMLEMQGKKA